METYRGSSTNKGLRRLLRKYAEGGAFYDPMGNVTMPPEEGSAPSLMYEQAMDAIAKAGATVGSPIIGALRTAADVYSNKSREAAAENEELRRQAMRNMAGDRAGMVPVGAGQMLLSQLGTATLPLTAAAKTIGHAATQATGNPRFGENVELLSGFVDPSHVGMLKATAPMVGAAAARQAVQVAREVTPVAQATRELSPLGFYSHGAETAANLAQAKGTPDQMTAMLRKYGVKPDEFYSAGIADETATNVMRSKIEREYAPKLAAAKLEMDALGLNENTINKKSPDYNKALDIRQSPETKAKYQYDSTLNAMRSDMDSAMVLHPEWSSRPSVTRDELTQYFNERRPQIEETVLGTPKPEQMKILRDEYARAEYGEDFSGLASEYKRRIDDLIMDQRSTTKFQQYTLPGGENYREVLLKLPERIDEAEAVYAQMRSMSDGVPNATISPEYKALQKQYDDLSRPMFRDPHWDDPNVIVHLRFSDRVGPNGEKILHMEEAQSGWGQKGRKEGFDKPKVDLKPFEADRELARMASVRLARNIIERESGGRFNSLTEILDSGDVDLINRMRAAKKTDLELIAANEAFQAADLALQEARVGNRSNIPSAPYVTNTAAWTDLALKRALKEAAEGGYDKLVWTPGAEQAKRYSLSNHVDEVQYSPGRNGTHSVEAYKGNSNVFNKPNATIKEIADTFGQEIAEKIASGHGEVNRNTGYNVLSGLDLVTGGEGMKGYYDKIFPTQLGKLVKKLDPSAKVGITDVMLPQGKHGMMGHNNPPFAAPGVTITPKMRDAIMKGQTEFARGGSVKGYATGGPANNSLEALYNKYAEPTMRQRTRARYAEGGAANFKKMSEDDSKDMLERLTNLEPVSGPGANVAPFTFDLGGGAEARGRVVQTGPYIDIGGGITLPLRDVMLMLDASYGKIPGTAMKPNISVKGGLRIPFAEGGPVSSAAIYDPAEIDALAASIIEGNYA